MEKIRGLMELIERKQEKGTKLTGYETFVSDMYKAENAEVLELIQSIHEIDGKETEDNISALKTRIDGLQQASKIKNELVKRLRVLEKRIGRNLNDNFGSYIRHVREAKGYSLKDMENLTGYSHSYVCRIESGERKNLGYSTIESLAKALDINVNDLLEIAKPDIQDSEIPPVTQVLYSNDFSMNGRRVTRDEKELIIELMDKINSLEWGANKHIESLELVDIIDRYKSLSSRN